MVALAFWAHPSAVMCSVWHFHVCSCFRKTFGIRNQVTDCTSLIKGLGWFDLMALPNVHINPTVLTPADSVWVFYGYLLPKAQFNMKKSKLLCVYLYHQWNGSTIPLPTLLSMLLNWHSLGVEGCITHKLEVRKHSIVPWLAEEKLWRSHGGKGKPSSCIATFLCSFATETGRCQKARVWVTYNLWICDDSPSQLLSQSFAAGNPDTRRWMRGMTDTSQWNGHRRAEGESCGTVLQQMAARSPTRWARSHNTGNVRSSPIRADQQPPLVGLWGGRRWSEGPWPSAL